MARAGTLTRSPGEPADVPSPVSVALLDDLPPPPPPPATDSRL
jgi:hypothetical protein